MLQQHAAAACLPSSSPQHGASGAIDDDIDVLLNKILHLDTKYDMIWYNLYKLLKPLSLSHCVCPCDWESMPAVVSSFTVSLCVHVIDWESMPAAVRSFTVSVCVCPCDWDSMPAVRSFTVSVCVSVWLRQHARRREIFHCLSVCVRVIERACPPWDLSLSQCVRPCDWDSMPVVVVCVHVIERACPPWALSLSQCVCPCDWLRQHARHRELFHCLSVCVHVIETACPPSWDLSLSQCVCPCYWESVSAVRSFTVSVCVSMWLRQHARHRELFSWFTFHYWSSDWRRSILMFAKSPQINCLL